MSLAPGTRLGGHQVLAPLGAGGMGEVYRARDTRLNREVALKILPAAFAADPDRLARFRREAQVLASLNHPHIAAIHGFEESAPDGSDTRTHALVLELVEGPTLADLIARGALPADQALPIAKQIAEALEAAHRLGIVHRDLKPANIKVRPDGMVKVLDFGLAKAIETGVGSRESGVDLIATISSPAMTARGVILGTAAYMSPEQARGDAVDHQADIWAFGCVLFEMLTGRRPFPGRTVSDAIAAVLRAEPDWTLLPQGLHPRLRLLLERCLEKDRATRGHSMADARVDVEAAASGVPAAIEARGGARPSPVAIAAWAAAAAAVAAALAGLAAWTMKPAPAVRVERFAHVLPPGDRFMSTSHGLVAISPDGASIVYGANESLYLRPIDRFDAQPIAGTRGSPTNPFFAPDGRSIGYHDFKLGQLRRIPVSGGTAVPLAPVTNLFGATWSDDDTILFGQEDGIWRMPASGGTPVQLVKIEPGERVHAPQLLPGGRALLFTLRTSGGSAAWEDAKLAVQSLDGGGRRIIGSGRDGRYLATGHLVYGLQSALFAVPFDLAALETRGAPVALVDAVRPPTRFPGTTGTANYDVSATGTLVYVAGEDSAPVIRELVAVDRGGNAAPILAEKREYWRPRVSPDGLRIVVEINERGTEQLWIVDAKAGTASALTSGGANSVFAAWSPDGQAVFYRSNLQNAFGIYRHAIDGGGGPQLIHKNADEAMPGQVSTDGTLVFAVGEQTGRRGIFTLPLSGGPPSEFLATPALEHMPMFSPDGRWVAYASNQSGRSEVWVRAFPRREETGRRVSQNGGTAPVWSRNGSELFYRDEGGTLIAVPVRLDGGLSFGRPEPLFKITGRFRMSGNAAAYDVDAAGRFIMVTEPEVRPAFAREIGIVTNWHEELRRLAPPK